MNTKYKIIKIDEPDFGCEGRPEGLEIKDKVYLEDENQNEFMAEINDNLLYELNISEGDYVDRNLLQKNGIFIVNYDKIW